MIKPLPGLKTFSVIICLSVIAAVISSCDKEGATTTPSPLGTVYLQISTNLDSLKVDSGVVMKDAGERNLKLNVAQFYISGISLKKSDGTSYAVKGKYILKTIGEEQYLLGNVPASTYTSISFNIGVDEITNKKDPSALPSSSPLSRNSSYNWFGSTDKGYIFMNIQGYADTLNNGVANCAFSYQLGTADMLRSVSLNSQSFTVGANNSTLIHIVADYGKLLKNINFKTQKTATPWNNATLASQIADNIPLMFRYQ